MKTLHEENLEKAVRYLRVYKEKQHSKLFQGTRLQSFTREELIKILDILYTDFIIPIEDIKKGE